MQKVIAYAVLALVCLRSIAAEVPVSATLWTATYSWSYEKGDWDALDGVRHYDEVYDAKGRLAKSVEYYDDKHIYRTVTFDYSKNAVPDQLWTGSDGKPSGSVTVRRDGPSLVEELRSGDGRLIYSSVLTLDDKGRVVRMVRRNADKVLVFIIDFILDAGGNISRKVMRNADGSAVFILDYKYEYDGFGNWISRQESMSVYGVNRWPKEIVRRKLEY